jgi:hypothetical protein
VTLFLSDKGLQLDLRIVALEIGYVKNGMAYGKGIAQARADSNEQTVVKGNSRKMKNWLATMIEDRLFCLFISVGSPLPSNLNDAWV